MGAAAKHVAGAKHNRMRLVQALTLGGSHMLHCTPCLCVPKSLSIIASLYVRFQFGAKSRYGKFYIIPCSSVSFRCFYMNFLAIARQGLGILIHTYLDFYKS